MKPFKLSATLLCFLGIYTTSFAQNKSANEKTVYIPKHAVENIDFSKPENEYSETRRKESKNMVVFWSKEYGQDPTTNPVIGKRFNVDSMLNEFERFYDYYVNSLKILKKGHSVVDKHKILCFVNGGEGGTAYGWGQEKVGILWTPATRVNQQPYGVLAHELGHVFQYLAKCDNPNNASFDGSINEMGAQYVLWQVYPDWFTFENKHLKDYLKNTFHSFLHTTNAYHAPFMLEYWAQKHGKTFYGKLLHQVQKNEDVAMTYQRITSTNQQKFNDEMFDAARHFVTWDLKRVDKIAKPYRNLNSTKLDALDNGWYRIKEDNCPENYGYNAIGLTIPQNGKVSVDFTGLTNEKGFTAIKTDQAGWRYGFLAYTRTGKRIYGKTGEDNNGTLSFDVPKDTEKLWLVVMGAPKSYWKAPKGEKEPQAQWPYQIKLTGAKPL